MSTDALQDRLAEAAVLTDGLLQEAHGDDRVDLALLGAQLSGSLHLVTRLLQRRTARTGKDVLRLGERQRREIEGRPSLEVLDQDKGSGPA